MLNVESQKGKIKQATTFDNEKLGKSQLLTINILRKNMRELGLSFKLNTPLSIRFMYPKHPKYLILIERKIKS